MCKAHEKKQGFGERGDSERERCVVMCQVMCVWAQRAGTVLRFPILEKECMRGRLLLGTCTHLSLALSGSALCLCSVISLSCHHSYICTMSSQHSRPSVCIIVQVCVSIFVVVRVSECEAHISCARMHMYVVCVSLMSLSVQGVAVPDWCVCWSSALELSGTLLKPVSSN